MRVLILGGGISGLSAAWFLSRLHPESQITLLEKTNRLGGWIQTKREDGFFYEMGPRTFQISRSPFLLRLIQEVGLENELIFSDPQASSRYLWHRGNLRSLPSLLPRFLPALFREPFISKRSQDDESIYDFATRRFSSKVRETLFDPLTLGIYAGDIRKLSIRSCFPKFFEWEKTYGSLLCGMFSTKGKQKKGLFTLLGGVERLIEEMQKKIQMKIEFDCEVESIQETAVIAGGKKWEADQIFSALPAPEIGRLTGESFSMNSLSVVHIFFEKEVLSKKGFGYLVPTQEKESLLGMVWDSSVFPQQSQRKGTRLTAMVRKEEACPKSAVLEALQRHLKINVDPIFTSLSSAQEAIPLFELGYWKKISLFEARLKKSFPQLRLLGNYFENVSVEGCIEKAFKVMIGN